MVLQRGVTHRGHLGRESTTKLEKCAKNLLGDLHRDGGFSHVDIKKASLPCRQAVRARWVIQAWCFGSSRKGNVNKVKENQKVSQRRLSGKDKQGFSVWKTSHKQGASYMRPRNLALLLCGHLIMISPSKVILYI